MGNNILTLGQSSSENTSKYLQKLNYIMESRDSRFGDVKIYKMKQKPFEYVMCKKYSALIDDPYIAKRKQKYIDTPVNKSIIPFELVELKTVQQKCGKHLQLTIYCRYYFYTLEEYISKKMKKQSKFSQQQILYVMKTLVSLYETFHSVSKKQYGIFRTSNLFLSPEGFLKIYPYIEDWKEQRQTQNQSYKNNFFLSQSEVEFNLNLNKDKKDLNKKPRTNTDIIDIGIILVTLIFTQKQSDYRTASQQIRYDIIKFILNYNNQHQYKNLNIYRNLLKGIFENKWQINQIHEQLQNIAKQYGYKNSTRIRLIANDQDSEQTINGQFLQRQRFSRLKNISNNNLIPGRINCLSSRLSANNKN